MLFFQKKASQIVADDELKWKKNVTTSIMKNNVDKSWSNIDVILKQRHDELPKLVDTCKGYMKHERQTLENIVNLRAKAIRARSVGDKIQAEQQLGAALGGFFHGASGKY